MDRVPGVLSSHQINIATFVHQMGDVYMYIGLHPRMLTPCYWPGGDSSEALMV